MIGCVIVGCLTLVGCLMVGCLMMIGPILPCATRQHMSAYVSIRLHTSAYVSIRQHTGFAAREALKIQDSRAQQHLHVL